ncbi:Periplasmic aromatic aldehyde oxidoreductase, molybdenum binding subunit YagR [Acetobacter tropicalis]|uniref:Periplasmic aromatic aldehyde oxidoreductase, molybdenum binding subunit YagR n=1 Tax=Acetobacter tropicalis TaxID=104102 RepID=A0A094YY90_9PROT|nr:Periplasmic aromatic aldehyde oxidoreductase, molybdenum binding subunit YagR [Acetobacter tropicalis]
MKFDRPAGHNPIDQLRVVGKPIMRVEGRLKTTGTAPYAYERHDVAPDQAYGVVVGSSLARGRIRHIETRSARMAGGVLAVVTALDVPPLERGPFNAAHLFGGREIEHYHQAIAVVVARTFEQARAAAALITADVVAVSGAYDLAEQAERAPLAPEKVRPLDRVGDFEAAFAFAPMQLDQTYTTPDHTHAMMEPHATIAAWHGEN